MKLEPVREFCLSLPFATEDIQWEHALLFRVGGKMFAIYDLDSQTLAFKCTPEEFEELILREGIVPAPYLARNHWVQVNRSEALRLSEVKRLINDSYRMVFEKLPKKEKQKLLDSKRPAVKNVK